MNKKKIVVISGVLVLTLLVLGYFLFITKQESGGIGDGVVSSATGDLFAQREQQNVDLHVGDPVFQHDVITTEETTTADITFVDGSKLRLAPATTIAIAEFAYGEENSFILDVLGGAVRTVTGDIVKKNPLSFQLKTPKASLGIRGTEFFASVYDAVETFATFYIDAAHTLIVENQTSEQILTEPLQLTVLEKETLTPPETFTLQEMENKIDSISPTLSGSIPTSAEEQGEWNTLEDYDETVIKNYHNLTTTEILSEEIPYFVNITGNSLSAAGVTTGIKDDIINIGTTVSAETGMLTLSTLQGNDKVNLSGNLATVAYADLVNLEEDLEIVIDLGEGDDILTLANLNEHSTLLSYGDVSGLLTPDVWIKMGTGSDQIEILNVNSSQLIIELAGNLITRIEDSYIGTFNYEYAENSDVYNSKVFFDSTTFHHESSIFSNTLYFDGETQIDAIHFDFVGGKNEISNFNPPQSLGIEQILFSFTNKAAFVFFENETINTVPYHIVSMENQSAIVLGKNVQAQYTGGINPVFLAGGTLVEPQISPAIYTYSENFKISSDEEYEALGLRHSDHTLYVNKNFWSEPTISQTDNYQYIITFSANNGFTLQVPSIALGLSGNNEAEVRALIEDNGESYVLTSVNKLYLEQSQP